VGDDIDWEVQMKSIVLASVAAAIGLLVGSGSTWGVMAMTPFDEPQQAQESAEMPFRTPDQPPMDELDEVIARTASELKDRQGVHGVGRGYGRPGEDGIVIFVDNADVKGSLPNEIEGYPVVVEVVPGGFTIQVS
jgi:hypothetical protein